MYWYMPIISVHGRLRQEDLKVGVSLCVYTVNHSPKCRGTKFFKKYNHHTICLGGGNGTRGSMNAKTNGFLRSDGNLHIQHYLPQKIITEEKEICGAENSVPTFIKLYHKQCIKLTHMLSITLVILCPNKTTQITTT